MNASTVAVTSYVIAIVISFFVAGLIGLMGLLLARCSKEESDAGETVVPGGAPQTSAGDSALAAVIAIARSR